MKKSSYTKLAIAVTAALSFGPSAQAAPATWNASPTIGNWEAAGAEDNWSTGPGTFPGALSSITDSDTATFLTSSGTTIAINATASNATSLGIGSITFGVVASASAFTIGTTGGNSLLLGNGGQIGISSGRTVTGATETVNAPLVLEPASATTAGAYTFSNASGLAGDILKIGGTVTGGTTTQGITLTLTGSSTTANEISGIISNGGAALGVAVTKASSGTWSLSGTNSYTGVTTIAGGVLLANSANALNTTALGGNVTFTGGTLRYGSTFAGGANADISSRIKNSTSAISIDTNGFNATFASALDSSNTGGLTKSGTGTLTLSVANSYTGNTTISNNGTLAAGNDAAFGTGTVVFLGGSPNASTVASSANVTLANNFTASGAFATFNASGGTMTINGNFTGTQQVNLTPTNKITFAGTNSLVSGFGGQGLNIGAGAGGVDFTGSTTVSGASTAAGAGYLLISGTAVSVKTGGTLTINGTTNASKASVIVSNSAATGTLSVDGGTLNIGANMGSIVANGAGSTGVLTINTGTATFTSGATVGTTDVRSYIALGQNTSSGTINLNGGILATGRNFVRDGNGTADATGTAAFVFGGGTLKALANQTDWLNTATINTNQLALTSVTTTAVSTIDANGFGVAINSAISGAGGFTITNTGGAGTGIVTFGGVNTYNGATTVSAGKLALAATGSIANSTVIDVRAGATFDVSAVPGFSVASGQTLMGKGTIIGSTTINGTLSPGASPGQITFQNNLTLANSVVMEIQGITLGTTYDNTTVSGSLTYGGTMTLNLAAATADGTYDLFSFTGPDTGSFSGIALGGSYNGSFTNNGSDIWTASSNGQDFTFTEATGDLVVAAVPEPSTWAAILGGAGLLGLVQRRRRRQA